MSVVALMLQNPYDHTLEDGDIKVANMQADGVVSYDINATDTYAKFISSSVIAYDDYNKFINPDITFIQKDTHNINANEAIYKDDNITFIGDVKYLNLVTNLRYNSSEILYGSAEKILLSNYTFELIQNRDKILVQCNFEGKIKKIGRFLPNQINEAFVCYKNFETFSHSFW